MQYFSTRLSAERLNFSQVVMAGLASDGGLYLPMQVPQFSASQINEMQKLSYQELFFALTKEFIGNEIGDNDYRLIINKSYQNFHHKAIAPIKQINSQQFLLELFHGPTLAFKDFALQFIGNLLDYFLQEDSREIVIIGATSGDTGSAAIQGCLNCKNSKIFILHPHQKVSEVQRKQMTTVLAPNVFNLAVEGSFDDCQAMVKSMFLNRDFLKNRRLIAVNSINFARIMAQIVYYFYSALRLGVSQNNPVSFAVPTGNFGDIYAGFMAKKMGLPIAKLIIATNENDILDRLIKNNDYSKDVLRKTFSPSMDIQVSSNLERLIFNYYQYSNQENLVAELMKNFAISGTMSLSESVIKAMRKDFISFKCSNQETVTNIAKVNKETNEIIDPHTATAVSAVSQYCQSSEYQGEKLVIMATAHPAKFSEVVMNSGINKVDLPLFLNNLYQLPEKFTIIENDIGKITKYIGENLS